MTDHLSRWNILLKICGILSVRTMRWQVAPMVVVLKTWNGFRATYIPFSREGVEGVKEIVPRPLQIINMKRSGKVFGRTNGEHWNRQLVSEPSWSANMCTCFEEARAI